MTMFGSWPSCARCGSEELGKVWLRNARGPVSDDYADLFASPHELGSYGGCTKGTQILVFLPVGKDQKQAPADGHSLTTFGAVQFRSVKFLKGLSRGWLSRSRLVLIDKKSALHGRGLRRFVEWLKYSGLLKRCQEMEPGWMTGIFA